MLNLSIDKMRVGQAFVALSIALVGAYVSAQFPVRGPFGVDFTLGSAFAYFYLQFDRKGWWSYIVAGIIASSTWILWGHPYAAIIAMGEFLFVALWLRRMNPLATLALFWMAIGPLVMAFFYGRMLEFPRDLWFIVYVKQAMNGILCVSIGTFLATFVRLTFNGRSFIHPISVIGFATSGVLPFVLIPTVLLTFENAREEADIRLALHGVAWSQFGDAFGDVVAPIGQPLTAAGMERALATIKATKPDLERFAPIRVEAIDDQGRRVSACYPSCPIIGGADNPGRSMTLFPDVPNTTVFLPDRDSLMQRWRSGSLTTILRAEAGHRQIRATTSLQPMVDGSYNDIRQDFFLLMTAVALIMAVGAILYNRVVSPFVQMREALDGWQSYDFSVPDLPPQKFIEIERFRVLLEQVSKNLAGERDRSMELQMQLSTIAAQSPMIFAAWLMGRRYADPVLEYISARPEERLLIGADMFASPAKALARLHPEDRPALRTMLGQLKRQDHAGAELRLMGVDGEWRWILLRLSARRAGNGMREVIGVFTDITELNSMRALLGQTSGITMIGRMVAGLAHELNQPLNVISMAADNLLHFVASRADALGEQEGYLREKSEKILHQVRRAGSLLRTVESIANQDARLEESHDLTVLLRESCQSVQAFADELQVRLVCHMPDGPMPIRGNKQALTDSFSAVLRNAVEAVHGRPAAADEGEVEVHVSVFSKISRVKIEVIDNGPGIDPDIMPYLFSPFMSIKATAQGAGLSLAKLFSLVQACGGEVYARNNQVGATVTIYLPLV